MGLGPALLAAWFFGDLAGLGMSLLMTLVVGMSQTLTTPNYDWNVLVAPGLLTSLIAGAVGRYRLDVQRRQHVEQELHQRLAQQAAALQASQHDYRQILDLASDAIFISGPQGYEDVNEQATLLTGYTRPELLTMSVTDLIPPEDLEQRPIQRAAMAAGQSVITERRLRRKTGEVIFVEANGRQLPDGRILAVVRDITERQKLLETWRQRIQELEVIHQISAGLRAAPSVRDMLPGLLEQTLAALHCETGGIRLYDAQRDDLHRVAVVGWMANFPATQNPRAGLVGHVYQTGEALVVPNMQLDPLTLPEARPHLPPDFGCAFVPIRTQTTIVGVLYVGFATSRQFLPSELQLLVTLAEIAGNAIHRAQLHEETQRYAAELETRVAQRTAELQAANAELARAGRLKDEFLASMSHELRTPLTAILAFAQLLQKQTYGTLTEKQAKAARTIEDSGRHLLALITDILDLSKIEAGQLALEREWVSLSVVCHASLELVKAQAAAKRQIYTLRLLPAELMVYADPLRLKQVVVNLLSNAVKFTPEDGTWGLEATRDPATQAVHLTVWDRGIGIAPADLPRLFQTFVQLDARLAREYAGTGLGLVMVRRLIELHGGQVSVTSTVGQGSQFTVSLPGPRGLAPLPPLPFLAPADVSPSPLTPASPARPRVLLADDNAATLLALTDFLESEGYRVITVPNGRAALARARAETFAAIVMDIQMPDMDGLEVMRRMRQEPALAHTPILALTALTMPGDRERCLTAGATDYVAKPFQFEHIREKLRQLIGG
jgi:PAS domain S-box-containing protein